MFILWLLSTVLILSRVKARRIVDGINVDSNNWDPFLFVSKDLDESPNYDITRWVRQLHLQQCAFVEIGEGFCALFVELRSIPAESKILDSSGVGEFFLGICTCSTLHLWDLCSPELTSLRKLDCSFNEATPYSNSSARVHRRLCDVTLLAKNAPRCNCSIPLAGQRLYKTKGLPTCFLNPLPESLCSPRNVCGIARCTATTINGIHIPQCSSNCHQRQPFCEEIGPLTSIPAEINSVWSRWSSPKCNNTCGRGLLVAVASCQDQVTGKPAIDCIGPGSFCCPDSFGKCYCEVNIVDGIMRAVRFTEPCMSAEGCTTTSAGTFTFEGELDPANNIDIDKTYENDDREGFEDYPVKFFVTHKTGYDSRKDTLCSWSRAGQRRLLQAGDVIGQDADEEDEEEEEDQGRYGLLENRLEEKNFKGIRGYRAVPRSRLDGKAVGNRRNDEDDDDDDEEEENEDGNSVGDEKADESDEEEEEEEEENREETIGLRGPKKFRRSPGIGAREARPDYAAKMFGPKIDESGTQGPMEVRSVAEEECEDESTEPPQYYDYDSAGHTSFNLRIGLVMQLAAITVLL